MLCVRDDSILLEQESGTRRKGMWKLPEISQTNKSSKKSTFGEPLLTMKYSITKYRVTLNVYQRETGQLNKDCQWFGLAELNALTLGAPYRRALEKLL